MFTTNNKIHSFGAPKKNENILEKLKMDSLEEKITRIETPSFNTSAEWKATNS
jgi:hypothetical protein